MRVLLKKFICIILSLIIFASPVISKENIKALAKIQHEFNTSDTPQNVLIKNKEEVKIADDIIIPPESTVVLEFVQVQKERRWHKSGFIISKLKGYYKENEKDFVDLSENNIYFAARKYEELNKKDAAILTTELILTQAASIVGSCFIVFAPVDIAYFFTKGAIQREKNPNWFKAGVSCAYDNSIFWFWLKGKPIDLQEDETVKIKEIKEKKALKLKRKIDKKIAKQEQKAKKKMLKKKMKAENIEA